MACTTADRLITYQAAAERLGVSKPTLRSWVNAGTIPVVRMGPRTIRFDSADVDRLLTPRTANPAPAVEVPQLPTREAYADYIARVLESAPPLTGDQVARLSALLTSAA